MFEWIGWAATAVFTTSYFCRHPKTIRRVQALGALFWLVYGIVIHSAPVIASNIVVAGVAIYSSLDRRRSRDLSEVPVEAGAPIKASY